MHVHVRSLAHAQKMVIQEICRFHPSLGKFDLFFERCAQSHGDGPFHLGNNRIRIDDGTTVHGANHSMNFDHPCFLLHRNFRHLGDVASKGVEAGNATGPPLGQGFTPTCLGCNRLKDSLGPRVMFQMLQPKLQRILSGRMSQLIHETFQGEAVVRIAHRTPERGWNRVFQLHVFHR